MSIKNSSQQTTPVEYKIIPPNRFSLDLEELWRYRELFYSYAWRGIRIKYKQSIFGLLWAIIQPLIMMVMFTIFFSNFLELSTDGIPAPVFYFSGLMVWVLFSTSVTTASNSMLSNSVVIKKVYFPRLIIPLSSVLVAFFDYLMTLILFAGMILFYLVTGRTLSVSLPALLWCIPLSLLITLTTSFGIGAMIGALIVKYRDFRFIIGFMIQILMFATPVIYPVSILDNSPEIKYILSLNPIMTAVNLARLPFMSIELDLLMVLLSLISMCGLFVLGVYVFKKTEKYFADLA